MYLKQGAELTYCKTVAGYRQAGVWCWVGKEELDWVRLHNNARLSGIYVSRSGLIVPL